MQAGRDAFSTCSWGNSFIMKFSSGSRTHRALIFLAIALSAYAFGNQGRGQVDSSKPASALSPALLSAMPAVPSSAEQFTAEQPGVVSFSLIDADSDQPVAAFDPIPEGASINLSQTPSRNLSIRANTEPATVGSVKFNLDS